MAFSALLPPKLDWNHCQKLKGYNPASYKTYPARIQTGNPQCEIIPIFVESIKRLEAGSTNKVADQNSAVEEDLKIFFHLPFHPKGIQRTTIRSLYSKTLEPHIPGRKLTVAVSRPKNIRDRLCKTVLERITGQNPSDILKNL